MKKLKVLVACEESQRVCTEFRKLGHEAYSADIQEPSGGFPEWHILGDVLKVLNGGTFRTMNKWLHTVEKWDLIIAFPPCTYLTTVATKHHSLKSTPLNNINDRTLKRIDAELFFMCFANACCKHIAIENPVGVMNTVYRKPDQIISPYMFAKNEADTENYVTKATCLWLKNLPSLKTNNLSKPDNATIYGRYANGKAKCWEEMQTGNRSKVRSKTFPGVATAMAKQWSEYIIQECEQP